MNEDTSVPDRKAADPTGPPVEPTTPAPANPAPPFNWGDGLSLEVSSSQMSAHLQVEAAYAGFYTPDDLERYLRENQVVFGINRRALEKIFHDQSFGQSLAVAKGRPPRHGEDGRVEWQVDLSILEGAALTERGGRVDWKERHHVLQVDENQLLARLIAPTPGESGMNVYGQELPATPGKEARFPAGKGVRISEDGRELYAALNGVVCREGDKISVTSIYKVQGDVSLETGHIDYRETVIITGGVLPDFKVKAGQDLHIHGLVEAAELEAGGNIFINGGIQGNQKAVIKAGGDLVVKFISNARVEAGNDVIVNGAITNSVVKAGRDVIVRGTKAVIVGGVILAEKRISAGVIGSELGVKTELGIGADLKKRMEKRNEILNRIAALSDNYHRLQQAVQVLNRLRDQGKLDKEKAEMRLKIIRAGLQMQSQIQQLQESARISGSEAEADKKTIAGVIAREIAWPGTRITIMDRVYTVKTVTHKARFVLLDKEIEVLAYKEGDGKEQEVTKSQENP
ncbi:MAG TPA: FapA family protein [bacterium]|nr:DUF342 domain-containing protein [Candidatus Omnitrophota bacterium]HOJ62596.1 FapA family protein [bacterium]HOL93508.1 FapA family protein [bacterium]HXK93438.1 FapA family protein [bacterium]